MADVLLPVHIRMSYDHNLSPRTFVFVGADFMSDALQGLNLRSVGSAGLGFHAIKNATTTLDLLAGGNYTHETYVTYMAQTPPLPPLRQLLVHNSAGLTLGEELNHTLSKSTLIIQKLYFYPNLSNTGDYRGEFDFGTVTKISKRLGWQNQFTDFYTKTPPPGKKKNDVVFTTGINFSFAN